MSHLLPCADFSFLQHTKPTTIDAMKRNNEGVPLRMIQRWKRPPISCQLCRAKKLRCDRAQPCSNCTVREKACVYAGRNDGSPEMRESSSPPPANLEEPLDSGHKAELPKSFSFDGAQEMLARIRKLEAAVFNQDAHASPTTSPSNELPALYVTRSKLAEDFTHENLLRGQPRNLSKLSDDPAAQTDTIHELAQKGQMIPFPTPLSITSSTRDEHMKSSVDVRSLSRHLPTKAQAVELFKHFTHSVQLTFGALHIPSTRTLLDQTYQAVLAGEEPDPTTLFLIFCIFAGATLVSTPQLLQTLNATHAESKLAFETYAHLALSFVEPPAPPLPPSTLALGGTISLIHLLMNADGFTDKVYVLQTRALVMARTMQIHRIDTAKAREQRRIHGSNEIEVEVQRRIWWHMVSSDWLLAFTGGPQEGTYLFQPRHMKVNYPRNVDDELMTPSVEPHDFPISVPTSMSAFIHRVRLAELCREVVDTIPSILLDPQELDYDMVLSLNAKFQAFIKGLPIFFQVDPVSIQQSRGVCKERPYIPWQRTILHFAINTRICRLHRPFHVAGSTNPKFSFSRMTCIRAAQTVLDLRRSMDDIGEYAGLKPSHFWTVMQHVFLAAITLATDVSLDPNAPYANDRKGEVLDACRMLEKSQQVSATAKEAIRRGVQTLMSMIQKQSPIILPAHGAGFSDMPDYSYSNADEMAPVNQLPPQPSGNSQIGGDDLSFPLPSSIVENMGFIQDTTATSENVLTNTGEQNWDQLWSEFFNAAPEWDAPQWTTLMEGIDLNIGPTIS
ncbi:hypothetical protein G7046_g2223 [Stylonectria norvegica]|nr:hypothetical protein G7046_g2223 [Stylonectria norvegica]